MKRTLLIGFSALLILGFGTSAVASTVGNQDMPLSNWSWQEMKERCLDFMSSSWGDPSEHKRATPPHHKQGQSEKNDDASPFPHHSEMWENHHNNQFHRGNPSLLHHHSESPHHNCINW